jgi:hypothetical protein
MKNPAGWAANLVAAREGKRATARDYAEAKNILQELHTKNEARI